MGFLFGYLFFLKICCSWRSRRGRWSVDLVVGGVVIGYRDGGLWTCRLVVLRTRECRVVFWREVGRYSVSIWDVRFVGYRTGRRDFGVCRVGSYSFKGVYEEGSCTCGFCGI